MRGGACCDLAPVNCPAARASDIGGAHSFGEKQMADLPRLNGIIRALEAAYNAVAACRYPRMQSVKNYEPAGIRGDGPAGAARYWGLSQQDYYAKADVWPLDPKGEVFVILQIEDMRGVENLDKMLTEVKGVGAILIGEGDLGQELGIPRQYEHPELLKQMARVVETCRKHNVIVGHPHVEAGNCERIIQEGYRFLMCAPV